MVCFFDFIFCRLAETLGFSISHVTFSEVTSVWGVSAVVIECVCVWSTKSSTMPAYCIAANCNNSQATQSITKHEFPRNRLAVRRKLVKFVQFKRADFYAAPLHHLCSEHFAECDFVNFMAEYQMWFASKRNL